MRVYAEAGGKSPLVLLDGWGKGLLSRHLENVDSDIKLYGWSDNDTIHGGGGDDKIYGGYGDDLLYGDADNDLVVGNYGNDTLHGGSGNDRLYGNTGDDKLYGEAGNDVLVGGAGKDYLDGGTGADILSYSGSTSAVRVDLGANTATGGHATGDKFVNLEHLFGSDHDDRLTGDTGANVISGGKGGDILIGGGGADRLYGDDGADVFILRAVDAGTTASYTRIRDFQDGEDRLDVSQRGSEVVRKTAFGDHTVLWLGPTNTKVLALLENITPDQITAEDLITLPEIA